MQSAVRVGDSTIALLQRASARFFDLFKLALSALLVSFPVLVWYNALFVAYWREVDGLALANVSANGTTSVPMSLTTVRQWYLNPISLHVGCLTLFMFCFGYLCFLLVPLLLAVRCRLLRFRACGLASLLLPASALVGWVTMVAWGTAVTRFGSLSQQQAFLQGTVFVKPFLFLASGAPLLWWALKVLGRELPAGFHRPGQVALTVLFTTILAAAAGPAFLLNIFVKAPAWQRLLLRCFAFPLLVGVGQGALRASLWWGGGLALPPSLAVQFTLPLRLAAAMLGCFVMVNLPTLEETLCMVLGVAAVSAGCRWTLATRHRAEHRLWQALCPRKPPSAEQGGAHQGIPAAPPLPAAQAARRWHIHFMYSAMGGDAACDAAGSLMAVALVALNSMPPVPGSQPLEPGQVFARLALLLVGQVLVQYMPLALVLVGRGCVGAGQSPPPTPFAEVCLPAQGKHHPATPRTLGGVAGGASKSLAQHLPALSLDDAKDLSPAFPPPSHPSPLAEMKLGDVPSLGREASIVPGHPPSSSGRRGLFASGRSAASEGSDGSEGAAWAAETHVWFSQPTVGRIALGDEGESSAVEGCVSDAGCARLQPVSLATGSQVGGSHSDVAHPVNSSTRSLFTIQESEVESSQESVRSWVGPGSAVVGPPTTARHLPPRPLARTAVRQPPPDSAHPLMVVEVHRDLSLRRTAAPLPITLPLSGRGGGQEEGDPPPSARDASPLAKSHRAPSSRSPSHNPKCGSSARSRVYSARSARGSSHTPPGTMPPEGGGSDTVDPPPPLMYPPLMDSITIACTGPPCCQRPAPDADHACHTCACGVLCQRSMALTWGWCATPGDVEEAAPVPCLEAHYAPLVQQGWGAAWDEVCVADTPSPPPSPTGSCENPQASSQGSYGGGAGEGGDIVDDSCAVGRQPSHACQGASGWAAMPRLLRLEVALARVDLGWEGRPAGFTLAFILTALALQLVFTYYAMRPTVRCPFFFQQPAPGLEGRVFFDLCVAQG